MKIIKSFMKIENIRAIFLRNFLLGLYYTFARNPLSDAKGGFLSKSMETSLSASLLVINPHCEALIGMIAAFFKTSICSGVQVEQYI